MENKLPYTYKILYVYIKFKRKLQLMTILNFVLFEKKNYKILLAVTPVEYSHLFILVSFSVRYFLL